MAAVVSGSSLGLGNTSLRVLDPQGGLGAASQGRAAERVYVNAATGNLVLQNRDELVLGRGPDLSLARTYNSQGQLNDDNGDNWRFGLYRRVFALTGTANTAGSTVTRVDSDCAESVYGFDTTLGRYVSREGSGAYDTLAFDSATQTWTFTDGDSRITERYDAANAGRITQMLDADGNGLTFAYNAAGLITQATDASGETTFLDYAGNNLAQLRTVTSGGQTLVRTRYAYDAANRLVQVITDLSPEDASIADANTYVVSYTYDGTSKRIASLTQTDGNNLAFTYLQVGADWKVASITDALGGITSFSYNTTARTTTVTDPLVLATVLAYDAAGQLTSITGPAVGGAAQVVSYAYDGSGNVTQVIDAKGNTITYGYDPNGNRTLERDAAGNTVTRSFGAKNELLTESVYLQSDPDGAGAGQPGTPLTTRYVYDAENHLRFVVSAEGRVTEYRYSDFGEQTAAIRYTGNLYSQTGLNPGDALSEAQLNAWVGTADKAKSLRTDSTYDFRGQIATTRSYGSVDASGNGVLNGTESVRQYIYDQAGNLLKTVDPRGTVTADPNDFATTYVYDGLGRVLSSVDALGRTTLTQYQDASRKTVLILANGLVSTSTYDATGNLVSVLQSSGSTTLGETKYFYDADGRLRRTQDPTGIKTHILYDELSRKLATIDGDGSLTEYRYDANNNVTRTIRYATAVSAVPEGATLAAIRPAASPKDRSTWNAYDAANRLVKSVDEAGAVTHYLYDGADRLTDSVRFATLIDTAVLGDTPAATSISPASTAADRLSRNFYDADGTLRGSLDGEGFLVEYKYDAAGQLVETVGYATATNPALRLSGALAQLIPAASAADIHGYVLYNARGQTAATVDAEGYLTETVYDSAGNKTQVVRYATKVAYSAGATLASLRPSANVQDRANTYTYDALNRVASETNFEGTLTQYTYDEVGNPTKSVKAANTAEVRTLLAQYDKLGRLTAELSAKGAALLTGNETQAQIDAIWAANAVKHTYDAAGRRTSTTDANGRRTLFFYNADGALTHTINALGEVKESVYNTLGQVTQTIVYGTRIAPAALATLSGGLNSTLSGVTPNALLDSKTSYAYTLTGALAQKTDPLGNAVTQAFNAFGEMVGSSQAIGAGQSLDHTYGYDKRGLLTLTRWDPAGLNTSAATVYDAFGRAVQSTDANGNVRSAAYDRLGRAVTSTDPLGTVRSTTYDAFDRVLTQTDALGKVTSYSYSTASRSVTVRTPENIATTRVKNRHGETISLTDGRGNTTTYTYDANGNVIRVDAPAVGAETNSYDAANQLIQSVDANGTATVYSYDAAGRVLTRTVDPGTGHLNLVTTYAYDAKGEAVSVTDASGVVTQTSFDLKGQVVSVTVDPGAGRLNLTTTYGYDARGKKLSVTEGAGSANPRLTQYSYDKLGRLLEERVDPTGINAIASYAYDKNDNVVRKTDALGNVTRYTYDANDRLVHTADALGGVTRNEYDANGRVVRFTVFAAPINLSGLTDASTPADIAARVVASASLDETKSYVYDADGRELYCIDALGGVTQKSYDANGNLVRKLEYANAIPTSTPLTQAAVAAALVASANDRLTRTVYDAADRAVYTIDAANYVKEFRYDNLGHIVATIRYAQQIAVGATPTAAEVAAALSPAPVTATTTNRTDTLFANPTQPYTYSASARSDVAAPATQSVAVTNSGQTNSTPPVQPYTYVASAKNDVASAASQVATLTIQNTTQTQSPGVKNYAWYRNQFTWPNSLATTSGMSLDYGYAPYGDTTPSEVRADIYLPNGTLYSTVYTDVGFAQYETWGEIPTDEYGNGGFPGYSGYHWYGASGWAGQVNLSAVSGGSPTSDLGKTAPQGAVLPAGNYTVYIYTRDDYPVNAPTGGNFDSTDGTWTASAAYNITVGTVAGPTYVYWATSLQPAGTTVSFKYRAAGSTGAYTNATVAISGTNHQANLGVIGNGSYEYVIEYRDSFGRLLKSTSGTLGTTAGQTTALNSTFAFTQVTSTASAGSSISGFVPLAQVPNIDRITATVTNAATGAVVTSNVLTYPEFEASYAGNVNLKVGSVLADGRYNVAVTIFYKNGTVENKPIFLYEVGTQSAWILHTVSWAASTAPAGTTPSFSYRLQGSTGAFISAPVTLAGANHQVALDHIAAGTYEYQVQYKDSFNRVLKSASSTFTVTGSGAGATNTTFSFAQVTSSAAAGSSITGYITAAEVPTIDYVEATVRDLAGALVSSALTYPEFEANYDGRVNLKVGSPLADGGKYNVTVAIHKKDGTVQTRAPFYYEVGPQPYPQRTTTVAWAIPAEVAGATVQFTYAPSGSSSFTGAPVTQNGASHEVAFTNLADGSYTYFVRYFNGTQLVREATGTFQANAASTSASQLRFVPSLADDPMSRKQVDSFQYDAAGRLVLSADAEGFSESYAYDAVGNKTSFTNKKGATWSYAYDAAGRLVSETSPQVAVTRPQIWSQDFSAGAAGLGGDGLSDPAFMRLENGRLVVQTPSVTPAIWRGLGGDRSYPFTSGATFRAEVNTGPASTGRSLIIGADNMGAGPAYRRLSAYFAGGAVYAHYYDPTANTWPSIQLGTIKDDTTYVVEVQTGASGATLFVYEQGRDRASGFSYTSAFNDWGSARSVMWTLGNTGQPASTMYVDNLTETAAAVTTETVTTVIGYDALGNVLSRTEASGRPEARTTQYRYDALGRQIRTVFPSVAVYNSAADNLSTNGIIGTVARTETTITPEVSVTYDALGNATVNRDAAGNYSYKAYDALGRVKYEIDAERYVTEYGYDRFDNRTAVKRYATALNFAAVTGYATHGEGAAFSAAEVAARLAGSAGDRTITTAYDTLNRATRTVEPTVYTFDSSAPAGSPQYFYAGKTTRNAYNAYGQMVKQSVLKNPGADLSAGTADDTWIDTYFYYDARGNKTAQVDPLGYLTTYQYDETGDLVRQVEYARSLAAGTWSTAGYGAPVATTPQSSPASAIGYDRETVYRYDRKNQKIAETRVNVEYSQDTGAPGGTPVLTRMVGDLTTTYGYDGVGNMVTSADASGATTYIYYDALGRVVAAVEPSRTLASGAAAMPLTEYKLDVFGNVVMEIGYARGAASATSSGYAAAGADLVNDQASYNVYDAHGKLLRSIDALGNSRYFSYDALGRTAKEWQPFNDGTDTSEAGSGLRAEYYDSWTGQLKTTRVDPTVNFSWGSSSPDPLVPVDNFFVRWSGQVQARTSETYTFYTTSDDGVRLWVNGQLIIDNWFDHAPTENWGSIALVAGQKYDIRMEFYERGGGATASLSWSSASQAKQIIPSTQLYAPGAAPGYWALGRENNAVKVYEYDKVGRQTATLEPLNPANPAEVVRSQARYNAFGEIVAKGQNDQWQESFDYDNAGRLWRTNGDDGVARTYLYDLAGKATSEFRSPTNNLLAAGIDSPDDVVLMSGNMRTDTTYDALERVTAQAQAAFSTDVVSPPSSTVAKSLTFGVAASASYVSDEYGSYWSGTNQINVGWNAMAGWGAGQVYVRVDYTSSDTARGAGVAAYRDVVLSSGAGDTGASIAWNDDPAAAYGGVYSIQRVQVWKQDNAGNWVLIHDQGASVGVYAKSLVWQAPTDLTTAVSFRFRSPGSATWTSAPVYNMGNYVVASPSGITGNGSYAYEINYTRAGEAAPYARATGTISSLDSASTSLTFGIASSAVNPYAVFGMVFWINPNVVNVSWNPIADWGGGDVQVTLDYMTYNASMGVGVAASQTQILSSANGNTGATFSWSDGGTADRPMVGASSVPYGGVQSVTRVRVWKKDAAGNWQLIHDRNAAANDYGRVFAWAAPAGTAVQFQYRPQGGAAWSALPVLDMGAKRIVDLRGLAAGTTYEYQLIYTPPGGASFTQASGTFTTAVGAPELVTVTPSSNPGLTLVQTPTLSQTLDRWGNTLSVSDPRNASWITRYRYNYENRLVEEIKPLIDVWGANGASTLQSPTVTNFYDMLGRAIGSRDANGNLITARYDEVGHLKAEYHPDGGVAINAYDLFGRKVRSTDPNGNVTLSTYDRAGRLLRQDRPIGAATYAYDQLGNRIEESVAASATTNLVTRYWYDSRGKVVRSRLPLESGETAAQAKDTLYVYDSRGNKIREVNANGDAQSWVYDYFGRASSHVDLGGVTYAYSYNNAGLLTSQTNNRPGAAQNLQYAYYENGLLKRQTDVTRGAESYYEYDAAGNRVRERFTIGGVVQQDSRIAYDRLNRIAAVQDSYYKIVYGYDANSNRRYTGATYYDQNGNARTLASWYAYDSMNRVTLSQGVLLGNAIQIANASSSAPLSAQDVVVSYDANGNRVATASGSIQVSAAQGVQLGYDAAGNRRAATSYQGGALATDSYAYDGNNRLVSTSRAGALTSSRTYDWAGRVTEMITYSGAFAGADNKAPQEGVSPTQGTAISERRVNTYNNKSWLLQQDIYNGAGTLTQRASYTNTSFVVDPSGAFAPGGSVVTVKSSDDGTSGGNGYDRMGNLLQYQVSVYTGTAYTNTYRYSYLKYDTYRESQISGSSTYFQPGATTTTYDANGAPVSVTETFATSKSRSFVVDGQGHVLAKSENGNTQRYFYVNDMQVGTSGALGPADFGQTGALSPTGRSDEKTNGAGSAAALTAASFETSYQPISDTYPAAIPGRYIVSQGDTLRSIALAVYGDAQLWYVIADANGLQSDADLRVGQTLTIPNKVTGLHNSSTTFKVYNPGEIIGDTTPTLPAPPPPPQHKGACGGFGAIFVAIVSIIVAIVLPVAFPAIFGPTAGLFGTVATAVVSNLAGQVTANIVGLQHGINFASIAVSALSAGITFGIVGGTGPIGTASAPNALGNAIGPIGRAIVGNVVNQGVGILLGQQHSFSWASVAGAAVGAAVTQTLSGNSLFSSEQPTAQAASAFNPAASFIGQVAGGLVRGALSGGRIDFARIAADAFGNVLGTAIGQSIAENIGQQQAQLQNAYAQTAPEAPAEPEPVPLPQPRPTFTDPNEEVAGKAEVPVAALSYADEAVPSEDLRSHLDKIKELLSDPNVRYAEDPDAVDDAEITKAYLTRYHLDAIRNVLGRELTPQELAVITRATNAIDAFFGNYQSRDAQWMHALTSTIPNPNDPRWNTSVDDSRYPPTLRQAGQLAIEMARNEIMANGEPDPFLRPGQNMTPEHARILANAFIRANYQLAQEALDNPNGPDRLTAMEYFAYAVHTLQDSTSPVHWGFQRWPQNYYTHYNAENFDPGAGSEMYRATQDTYNWFFRDRWMPGTDVFSRYRADRRP